ncbi:MAG: hypothetical protein ACTSWN_02485 [Promethearchaeota archaeon]
MDQKIKIILIILIAATMLSLGISYLQFLGLDDIANFVGTEYTAP